MIAYFSMEIAIRPDMPTYSGGLGVLAGDTLRSAADMGLRFAAVTLVHRKGYFRQHLDAAGNQTLVGLRQVLHVVELALGERVAGAEIAEHAVFVLDALDDEAAAMTGDAAPSG